MANRVIPTFKINGSPLRKSLITAKLLNLKDFSQICCLATFLCTV